MRRNGRSHKSKWRGKQVCVCGSKFYPARLSPGVKTDRCNFCITREN